MAENYIGKRVKELRLELKLEQKELVNELRKILKDNATISKSSISLIEKGERTPNFEVLKALAVFFNTSTDYLLGITDIRNKEIDNFRLAFSEETQGLSDNDIREALTFYKLVKEKNMNY